jgi:hypothetical protein
MADDDPTFAGLAPDWLVSNLGLLRAFLTNPATFIRKNIAELLVGGLLGLAAQTADVLATPWNIVIDALQTAGESVTGSVAVIGPALAPLWSTNEQLLFTVATTFGPLSPVALVALVVIEVVVGLRVLLAVFDALEEVVGSIPIIGGFISGATSGLRRLFGGIPLP